MSIPLPCEEKISRHSRTRLWSELLSTLPLRCRLPFPPPSPTPPNESTEDERRSRREGLVALTLKEEEDEFDKRLCDFEEDIEEVEEQSEYCCERTTELDREGDDDGLSGSDAEGVCPNRGPKPRKQEKPPGRRLESWLRMT